MESRGSFGRECAWPAQPHRQSRFVLASNAPDSGDDAGRTVAWCDVKSCRDAYRECIGVKSTNAAGAPAEIALQLSSPFGAL